MDHTLVQVLLEFFHFTMSTLNMGEDRQVCIFLDLETLNDQNKHEFVRGYNSIMGGKGSPQI